MYPDRETIATPAITSSSDSIDMDKPARTQDDKDDDSYSTEEELQVEARLRSLGYL